MAARQSEAQAAQQAATQKAEEEEAARKQAQEAAALGQAEKDVIQKAKVDAAARLLIEEARQTLHKEEWAAEAKEAEAEKARQAERNHVAAEAAKKEMQDYKKAQVLKAAAQELGNEQRKGQQTRQAYADTDLSNTSELTMAGTDDSRTEADKPKATDKGKKRVTSTGMGGLTGGTKTPFKGVVVPKLALPTSGTGGASPLPTLQTGDRVAGNKADFKGKCLYCQGPVNANDKRIKCSAGYCE